MIPNIIQYTIQCSFCGNTACVPGDDTSIAAMLRELGEEEAARWAQNLLKEEMASHQQRVHGI